MDAEALAKVLYEAAGEDRYPWDELGAEVKWPYLEMAEAALRALAPASGVPMQCYRSSMPEKYPDGCGVTPCSSGRCRYDAPASEVGDREKAGAVIKEWFARGESPVALLGILAQALATTRAAALERAAQVALLAKVQGQRAGHVADQWDACCEKVAALIRSYALIPAPERAAEAKEDV